MAQIAEARARQINFSSFVIDEWFLGVGLASSAVFLFRGDAVATHLSTPSGHALLFGWLFATSFGCCLSVVRHADHLAIRLGEPYGTLIPLGSVLSTIGLTIPVMICIGQLQGSKLVLGLQSGNAAMLVLTLVVNLVTFASGRTNIYRERVATLQDTLSAAGGTSGAASALRALMEKIVLAPALDAPDGLHVELHGIPPVKAAFPLYR